MYEKLSNRMAWFLIKNGVGKNEYLEVYAYGFENVISTIFNTIILLLFGVTLGLGREILVYMCFFAMLRNNAGGMHKSTHFSCVFTYGVVAFFHIMVLKGVFQNDRLFAMGICVVYLVTAFLLVFKYAPADSKNKRLCENEKEIQKNKSRKVLMIEAGVILGMVLGQQEWLAMVATAAVMTQAITLLPIINN